MPLNWDLRNVRDDDELWVEDGFGKVAPQDIDPGHEDPYWVLEEGEYRHATDDEIMAAREGEPAVYQRTYRLNGMTETLIWTSIPVGIPKITEENVDEFFRRVQEIEKDGALMYSPDGPSYFTKEDIERHIGLRTNVTTVTKRTFDAKMRRKEKDRQQKEVTT